MITAPRNRHRTRRQIAGFGLVDALVALSLLAVTLLGACSSLHFSLRASRAAAWQARAVDLVADLDEDLQHADPSLPIAVRLESWRARLLQALPAAEVRALVPRALAVGETSTDWLDLGLAWNGTPGRPRESLRLPLAHASSP